MDHSIIIQMYIRGCKIFSSGMICLTISHLPMKSTILNTFHEKEQFNLQPIIRHLIRYGVALFRKKRFLVNLKTERNASKFAMFMEKENPCSFFIFHLEQLSFFPYSQVRNESCLKSKTTKLYGFSFPINIANFEAFLSDQEPFFFFEKCK